jgi:tetratricopeptide (TPR) repeat protein
LKEAVQLYFDNRDWEIGHQASDAQQLIVEYVFKGEAVHNWSELVTVQKFSGMQKKTTPEQFMKTAEILLKASSPQIAWNVLSKSDNDIMYEWEITNSPDNEHEITRIISGKQGIYAVDYATKKIPISPDKRQEWIKLLNSATLVEVSQENISMSPSSASAQETKWAELNKKAYELYRQGKYSEAIKVAESALELAKKTFEPDNPTIVTSLYSLAVLYQTQGKYAEAESFYKQALRICEKYLEPDHPSMAVLENMARFYKEIGKEDEFSNLDTAENTLHHIGCRLKIEVIPMRRPLKIRPQTA